MNARRLLPLLLVPLAALQVSWGPGAAVQGTFPNLVLLAVVGWTWLAGAREGLWWALAGGLALDLGAAGPLGPHALACLVPAYLTGIAARSLAREALVLPALAAALASFVYGLLLLGAADTLGQPVPRAGVAVQLLLASAVYNAVLMPLAVLGLRRLRSWLGPAPAVAEW